MVTINTNKYKAVIFDMDGTMVDTNPWHKKAYEILLKKYNKPFTDDYFKKNIIGHLNSDIFTRLFPDKSKSEIDQLINEKEAIFRDIYKDNVKEVDGLTYLINKFKIKGLKLAIATTTSQKNRECILNGLKFSDDMFSVILGEEDILHGKPHPEIYLKTAEKLGVQPRTCVVFEDSVSGILSGKNAGMTVIAIATNKMPDTLKKADYIVNSFNDVDLE